MENGLFEDVSSIQNGDVIPASYVNVYQRLFYTCHVIQKWLFLEDHPI